MLQVAANGVVTFLKGSKKLKKKIIIIIIFCAEENNKQKNISIKFPFGILPRYHQPKSLYSL
jgi:hypothetical protein